MNIEQILDTAEKWRSDNDEKTTGVVVVYDNQVAGWMNELRDPSHWQPGCVAIDENRKIYLATGGDDQNGAKLWLPVTKEESSSLSL